MSIRPALRRRGGVWFGWSGADRRWRSGPAQSRRARQRLLRRPSACARTIIEEFYNGFANRVLWPILHYRLDLAEFTRRDLVAAISASTNTSPSNLEKLLRPDDVIWVHDYHLIPLAQGAARARAQEQDRLFPARAVPAAGNSHRAAKSRAAYPGAGQLRSGRLPDRNRRRRISPAISRMNAG